MMSIMHIILTSAIFWSSTNGLSFPSSSSAIETSVPFERSSRAVKPINYRLPDNVVPNSYKIKLIPDLDGEHFTFSGQSEIDISVEKATRNITLHAKYLNIDDFIQLKCHREGKPTEISTINISHKSIDNETDFLTIFLDEELLGDSNCNLTLRYHSTYQSSQTGKGFYATSYSENESRKRIASTQFEAIYARRAFPCWDEPAFKANFTISIEHNKKYVALSNMHVERNEESSQDSSRTTTHFAQTPKMSTYIVAFAIGDFATAIDNDTGSFRVWARKAVSKNGKYTQEIGLKVLNLLQNYLNSTYEAQGLKKIDIIAIPDLGFGLAMENWGLITWKESLLHLQVDSMPERDIEERIKLMAHELAHQWFGNLVTPSWWNFIWLSEGLSTHLENTIIDQLEPTWRLRDRFVIEDLQSIAFKKDSVRKDNHPMNQELNGTISIKDVFNTISYTKAACIIRMIAHVIGEDKFQTKLRQYIKAHAFNTATSHEFLLTLADDDLRLYAFMWTWVNSAGYPLITVTRDYGTETATIRQWRYLEDYHKSSTEQYYIPLNYVTEDNLDFNDTKITHWLEPHSNSIEIDQLNADRFVIFNKQQFGYYRVNYDERNWRMIAEFMRINFHDDIHVVNRAQLIDDAFHLAKINQLQFNVALNLIRYLKKERDFVVWNAVWRSVEITYPFVRDSDYDEQFKRYIHDLSEQLVDELFSIHLNENERFVRISRDKSLYWLCAFGSGFCISEAKREFNKWLDDHGKNLQTALPSSWILCSGSQNASPQTFDKLWEIYLNKDNLGFFQAMTCTSDQMIFKRYVSEIIEINIDDSGDFSTDFQRFVSAANGKNVDVVMDLMIEHYREILAIRAYNNDKLKLDLMALAEKLNNVEQLQKLTTFVETNKDSLNSMANEIIITAKRTLRVRNERLKEFKIFFEEDLRNKNNYNEHHNPSASPKYQISDALIEKLLRS